MRVGLHASGFALSFLTSVVAASQLSGSVDEKQLETLTTALTSIGLLERDADGRLSNPPTVEAFLSGSNPAWDFGDYLRFQVNSRFHPRILTVPSLCLLGRRWNSEPP